MKPWQKITIALLSVVLIATAASYTLLDTKYANLQSEYEQTQQILVNQTRLIVELRQPPRNFNDLNELTNWVNEWQINKKPTVISILNYTFVLGGELYSWYFDCDDIAEAMQRDAWKDGYLMDRVLIDGRGTISDTKVSNLSYHAGCQAIADNAFWFIEPQTGEIVMIVERD